jgi:hypothetical protein
LSSIRPRLRCPRFPAAPKPSRAVSLNIIRTPRLVVQQSFWNGFAVAQYHFRSLLPTRSRRRLSIPKDLTTCRAAQCPCYSPQAFNSRHLPLPFPPCSYMAPDSPPSFAPLSQQQSYMGRPADRMSRDTLDRAKSLWQLLAARRANAHTSPTPSPPTTPPADLVLTGVPCLPYRNPHRTPRPTSTLTTASHTSHPTRV